MPAIDQDRLRKVMDDMTLDVGSHANVNEGACVMEAAAWVAGEWTDHPACVSPVLGAFLRSWNDALPDDERQALKPYVPRIIGTRDDGHDETRAWMCTDWLVRTCTPAWLELAGLTESAAALRALPPILSASAATDAQPTVDKARKAGAAAGAAARDAARDALNPTKVALQQSAYELLDAMCALGEHERQGPDA